MHLWMEESNSTVISEKSQSDLLKIGKKKAAYRLILPSLLFEFVVAKTLLPQHWPLAAFSVLGIGLFLMSQRGLFGARELMLIQNVAGAGVGYYQWKEGVFSNK